MRKRTRLVLLFGGSALVVLAVLATWAYVASQQVPEFYQQAMAVDHHVQARASDEMLVKTTELVNGLNTEGRWEATFTDQQINGWLAVDLVKNHSQLLPRDVRDPRVAVKPGTMRLACRYDGPKFAAVCSLNVDVYLAEPNVLALRLHKARAGDLPLPLSQVVDGITRGAQQADLRIKWLTQEGDPLAMISLPVQDGEEEFAVSVDRIELREGAIYVAGKSRRATVPTSARVTE